MYAIRSYYDQAVLGSIGVRQGQAAAASQGHINESPCWRQHIRQRLVLQGQKTAAAVAFHGGTVAAQSPHLIESVQSQGGGGLPGCESRRRLGRWQAQVLVGCQRQGLLV